MIKPENKHDWEKKREQLKNEYPILTDEDLDYREKDEEKFIMMLESKLGKTKEEVRELLRSI
jgi:hypothetical protein